MTKRSVFFVVLLSVYCSSLSVAQLYTDEVQVINGLGGKVGIGTTAPISKLDVFYPFQVGQMFSTRMDGVGGFYISSISTSGQPYLKYEFHNGTVHMGTAAMAAPALKLTAGSAGDLQQWVRGGAWADMFIGGSGSTTELYMRANGTGGVKLASGASSWAAISDIRLKYDVGEITNSLASIANWRAITYKLKDDKDNIVRVGLVAQEVMKTRPEAVSEDENGFYSVRYTELIPDLVVAIQELKTNYDEKMEELLVLVKEQQQTIEQLKIENTQIKSAEK